jgi:hypothetical protein
MRRIPISITLLVVTFFTIGNVSSEPWPSSLRYGAQIAWGPKEYITEESWKEIPLLFQVVIRREMSQPHVYWIFGLGDIGFETKSWDSTAEDPRTLQFVINISQIPQLPSTKWWGNIFRLRLYTITTTNGVTTISSKSVSSYWIGLINIVPITLISHIPN